MSCVAPCEGKVGCVVALVLLAVERLPWFISCIGVRCGEGGDL